MHHMILLSTKMTALTENSLANDCFGRKEKQESVSFMVAPHLSLNFWGQALAFCWSPVDPRCKLHAKVINVAHNLCLHCKRAEMKSQTPLLFDTQITSFSLAKLT